MPHVNSLQTKFLQFRSPSIQTVDGKETKTYSGSLKLTENVEKHYYTFEIIDTGTFSVNCNAMRYFSRSYQPMPVVSANDISTIEESVEILETCLMDYIKNKITSEVSEYEKLLARVTKEHQESCIVYDYLDNIQKLF